jgi:hypothetical protein
MATVGQSAKLYQERKRIYTEGTLRGPGPQIYLPDNAVNHLKLEAPLPLPKFQNNPSAPDNALTQVWPHGDKYIT